MDGMDAALRFGLAVGSWIPPFLLVLARCIGLTLQGPVVGSRAVPGIGRVAVAFSLALVYFASLTTWPFVPASFLGFLVMVIGELLFGLLMGFVGSIIHFAIQGAGDFAAQASGLTMISTMNPMIRTNSTPIGQILYYVGLALFCSMGAHLLFLGGFFQSFALVPLGGFAMNTGAWEAVLQATGALLGIVLQLAMPNLMVILIVDVTLGLINRTTPQAQNLLDFVQTIKPGIGLLVVSLMIPNVVASIHGLTEHMITDLHRVVAAQVRERPGTP